MKEVESVTILELATTSENEDLRQVLISVRRKFRMKSVVLRVMARNFLVSEQRPVWPTYKSLMSCHNKVEMFHANITL